MTNELYKVHRPNNFSRVIGQGAAVKQIQTMLEGGRMPHFLLLTGPTGTGKTTLARIIVDHLDVSKFDFVEINCSNHSGIDVIRRIESRISKTPMQGGCRVWYMDEVHRLTKDAQSAALKMLEDTPAHSYFIWATTEPKKLLPTIRSRATHIQLRALGSSDITKLVNYVARKEQLEISEELLSAIVANAEGSARQALVILDQVRGMEDEEEQLEAANVVPRQQAEAFSIFRAMVYERKPSWKAAAQVLQNLEEEPEGVRRMLLACARTELLKANKNAQRCFLVIDSFRDHFYDSGGAGLAAACYEVISTISS